MIRVKNLKSESAAQARLVAHVRHHVAVARDRADSRSSPPGQLGRRDGARAAAGAVPDLSSLSKSLKPGQHVIDSRSSGLSMLAAAPVPELCEGRHTTRPADDRADEFAESGPGKFGEGCSRPRRTRAGSARGRASTSRAPRLSSSVSASAPSARARTCFSLSLSASLSRAHTRPPARTARAMLLLSTDACIICTRLSMRIALSLARALCLVVPFGPNFRELKRSARWASRASRCRSTATPSSTRA